MNNERVVIVPETPRKKKKNKLIIPKIVPKFLLTEQKDDKKLFFNEFFKGQEKIKSGFTSPTNKCFDSREKKKRNSIFETNEEFLELGVNDFFSNKRHEQKQNFKEEFCENKSELFSFDVQERRTCSYDYFEPNSTDDDAVVLETILPWQNPCPQSLDEEYFSTSDWQETSGQISISSVEIEPCFDFLNENFEILDKIGEGHFSTVFKVISKDGNYISAIKRIKEEYKGEKDRLRRLQEIRILWACREIQFCLCVFSAWEQSGYCFIETEFLEQGTLRDELKRLNSKGQFFIEEKIHRMLFCISTALFGIYQYGIVHCDIRPENIFLDSEDFKLGDFGLSVCLSDPFVLDMEGDRCYMPSEAMRGIYTHVSDVFSLGMVALELSIGQKIPEEGEMWHDLRNGIYTGIIWKGITNKTISLLQKMLHPQPELRPTAQEVSLITRNWLSIKKEDSLAGV